MTIGAMITSMAISGGHDDDEDGMGNGSVAMLTHVVVTMAESHSPLLVLSRSVSHLLPSSHSPLLTLSHLLPLFTPLRGPGA